jgi:hypothetical protein
VFPRGGGCYPRPVTAKDQALAATDALIAELESELAGAREARRKLSGEPDPPSRDELEGADAPKDLPEAILRVLQLSGQDALTANSIFGALDTRGWLTSATRADDKHFHKTLQRLFEKGTLVKPRRGMYARQDRLPQTFGDPAIDPAANGHGVVQEDFLAEET